MAEAQRQKSPRSLGGFFFRLPDWLSIGPRCVLWYHPNGSEPFRAFNPALCQPDPDSARRHPPRRRRLFRGHHAPASSTNVAFTTRSRHTLV